MKIMKNFFDAVILGGGASGLMCAVAAKQSNRRLNIAVIEKNDRVGKKLLATGNGRCNLTNEAVSADKYIGSFQKQSQRIFAKYNTETLLTYFKELGLLTFSDSEGRYYPVSKQASSVLDVLRFSCERLGVTLFCGESIKSVKKSGKAFTVTTTENVFTSNKLVIACGSKAAPKLGGSASGADYLRNLGHSLVPFSPALCPIKVNSPLLKSLKGIRATAKASLYSGSQLIKEERGEVQFTENALSGICVFNLSLYAKKGNTICLDLMDNISEKELYYILIHNKMLFRQLTIDNIFTGIFHKRLAQALLKPVGIRDFSRRCGELSDSEIKRLAKAAKNMTFTVTENAGFEQAQCALGGVLGQEIDETAMRSKICKNLYICGEAVDLCGECGGYNLHFAFASGITVGENL